MVATSGLTWSLLLLAASTCTNALSLHHKKFDGQVQRVNKGEHQHGHHVHTTCTDKMQDDLRSRGILPPRQLNESDTSVDQWVTLPLDHFGSDERTFDNRYWISASGYEGAGKPVFIFDNGEQAGHYSWVDYGWFKDMVDSFGGIGISWEHRYYGESISFNITTETDPEDMKFLSVEQALADVAVFASNFSHPAYPDVDLTPSSTPWIFVGGSYPGIRAALMRELYPEIIYAAYAASAPVEARVNMSSYFDPIWDGMHRYGYGNCTEDVRAALLHMDELLADDESAAAVKQQFLGPNADKNSNGDFAYALSTLWFGWQSSGPKGTIAGFCDYLETRDVVAANATTTNRTTTLTAGEHGWAPKMGAAWVLQKWAEWPQLAATVSTDCAGNAGIASPQTPSSSNSSSSSSDPTCDLSTLSLATSIDDISWTWQYCTQWGFLHAANTGPKQLTSAYNSVSYQLSLCQRQFPLAAAAGILPAAPAADALNELTGGWGMRPSNTFWTAGEFDPWRTLSPLSDDDDGDDDGAPVAWLTQTPPACGERGEEGGELFGFLLPDAQHCYDFAETDVAVQARGYFTSALEGWLECFEPTSGGGGGY
ncbi:serine family [Diplodia corticola]|uniref:Serine family n=1 Tax=Diplodia corticola TaxID=236234 RepID=A0A1J9RD93_9PEZI|nr:serine family [Diplodia corticola]OJD30507.1 serine family [Diplodia corticola]